MRRLIGIDGDLHMVEWFYPRLMPLAGRELAGRGIAMELTLAAYDYIEGLPSVMAQVVLGRMHQFLGAFSNDPEVLKDARDHLAAAGLPTD